MMKIAVINFSGNVGKSTISRHLLLPRLKDAELIPIETINSDGSDDEAMKGKQFGELLEGLALLDDAVIDIGASNVEDFINLMGQYKGSHEDFDLFVVPTVPKTKQQKDTISTIDALSQLGVPAKKIRLVFNMLELDETTEKSFPGLYQYHQEESKFTLNENCVIHQNDIYGKLKGAQQSIKEILQDKTDYKELIKKADNPEEKLHNAQLLAIKRLAAGVTEELDLVFKVLVK
jgi:hypothetical protein